MSATTRGAGATGAAAPLWVAAPALIVVALMIIAGVVNHLDAAYPPPLARADLTSRVVLDRNGVLLRAFATPGGRWRLPVKISEIDPKFIKMLLAYEDRRFYSHSGVDGLALVRAAGQLMRNGRIISGGSTLTMQVASLLEGRKKRSVGGKLKQILRAWQIERRLSKRQILALYLKLAPYGGNIEGVRAAALAYFGKEPGRLDIEEAALLVALPQAPEARRPDRHPRRAMAARMRVLERLTGPGVVARADVERVRGRTWAVRRRAMPLLAAHLAGRARKVFPLRTVTRLTIDGHWQAVLEEVVREQVKAFGAQVSIALIAADYRTGEVLAHVGSPGFFMLKRRGEIDMTQALRSPGSTLKPFIYGLGFENGVIVPETLIDDRPVSFSGYRPRNFDLGYQGTVSVRRALQKSLNIPAIKVLDAIGPTALLARFKRAGVTAKLPAGEPVGLAVGLGGIGISLRDLVALYASLGNGGRAVVLRDGLESGAAVAPAAASVAGQRVLSPVASWYVGNILKGVAPPQGVRTSTIAYKTGTSYGYRDAWSVGFDGRYVIGVWVGRADGASVPGITGRTSAAPVLFEAFEKVVSTRTALAGAPPGALHLSSGQLPATLRRFVPRGMSVFARARRRAAPKIVFPPDGVRVDLGLGSTGNSSNGAGRAALVLKLQGGRAPFRLLANGLPVQKSYRRRVLSWRPDSAGFSKLTVIDARGQSTSVSIFVE